MSPVAQIPDIPVAPDHFEVTARDVVLLADLRSSLAICVYDAVEEAGALLHLRCIVRGNKPADVTDTTLATELLLLDRCLQALREAAPAARALQARVIGHLDAHPHARSTCESVVSLVEQFLADADIRVLPADLAGGVPRQLRFRPGMGWLQTR